MAAAQCRLACNPHALHNSLGFHCVEFGLRAAQRVSVVLGITGMNVATRVGGLITAALAIEILASGLTGLFPGLKS